MKRAELTGGCKGAFGQVQRHIISCYLLASQSVTFITEPFRYQEEVNVTGVRQISNFKLYPALATLTATTAYGWQADTVRRERKKQVASSSEHYLSRTRGHGIDQCDDNIILFSREPQKGEIMPVEASK